MNTDRLLSNTAKLFEAIELFQLRANLQPPKDHIGSHIKLIDFSFNKEHLIKRLTEAIIYWVYSKKRAKEIFEEEFGETEDHSSAAAHLYQSAKQTFRIDAPQGQFGELLLNAFIQHIFKAAPLLRKQSVRTSDNHERFGADAIHYSHTDKPKIYLGESKCYKSSYQFPAAFDSSVASMNNTLASFSKEIRKFSVGGFIEEDLQDTAKKILSNKIEGIEIHPISIIIYNETAKLQGNSLEIKAKIADAVLHQCSKIPKECYSKIQPNALERLTYIVMPVWDLDALLNEFTEAL